MVSSGTWRRRVFAPAQPGSRGDLYTFVLEPAKDTGGPWGCPLLVGSSDGSRRRTNRSPQIRLQAPVRLPIFSRMTYIITQPCIDEKDASCVDVCPVDCIYEGEDQFYIHPEECIDCGACVPECPVEAIFPDDEVPEQWQEYTAKNYTYFDVPPP